MSTHPSALPFQGDGSNNFLPVLVALMVLLSAVALAGVFVLNEAVGRWSRDVSGTLTVQVLPVAGPDGEALTDQRVAAAVEVMRQSHGVVAARALDKKRTLALLEPWLGSTDVVRDMPLPRLIDVELDPDQPPDLNAVAHRLAQVVPGASLDDHRVWLSRLISLSETIRNIALGIVALIGGVTSVTVAYATRTSMALYRSIISLLHLVGASDAYIARRFARRAFALGLGGGLFGLTLAVPTLMLIGHAAARIEGGFLPPMSLPVLAWLSIGCLPLAAAVLIMMTAWLTVYGVLVRMP